MSTATEALPQVSLPDMTALFVANLVLMVVVMGGVLTAMAYYTWAERKLLAAFQDRVGPTRSGPFGLLQPLADAVKLLTKEDLIPAGADRWLFIVSPLLAFITAVVGFAVVPWGPGFEVFGVPVNGYVADVNVALLFVLAMGSIGVYGLILGGWASNNKYSLLGGLRAAAQVISYELILGLSLTGVVLLAGTLSLVEVTEAQAGRSYFGVLPGWFIFVQPLGFILYLIAAVAETNRSPFDLPEAETELVGGFHTEYSGFRFAMFFLAEYINMIMVSAIASVMFLGGYNGPLLPGPHWLIIKMTLFVFLYVWLRATLPRFRFDQLMGLAWKVLLPLCLLNLLVTALIRIVPLLRAP
jgi:NADH-quinone oxidoreductase subunit H